MENSETKMLISYLLDVRTRISDAANQIERIRKKKVDLESQEKNLMSLINKEKEV